MRHEEVFLKDNSKKNLQQVKGPEAEMSFVSVKNTERNSMTGRKGRQTNRSKTIILSLDLTPGLTGNLEVVKFK